MKDLKVSRTGDLWSVTSGLLSNIVAEIYRDPWNQVGEVVLYADSSDEIQLEVLHLAASHAYQYVRQRRTPVFGGLMVAEHRNQNLTRQDSDRLMSFSEIPEEIRKMDRKTVVKALGNFSVDVTVVLHRKNEDPLNAVLSQVGVEGLTCQVVPQRMIIANEWLVRFTVQEPNRFTFWHDQSRPHGGFDLHIVPAYHPVMQRKKSVGMVNGDTDAYIRGNAVRSIYCPEDARATDSKDLLSGSWTHVKHPYYATGLSFVVRLITTKIRSVEGMEELTQLLRAALDVDDKYISISGGFRAPLVCGHNRLLELGRRSPWPEAQYGRTGNMARGSEQHCVWAHRVLTKEGQLENAYIPSWFTREGWLEIYEGAEVAHGLY